MLTDEQKLFFSYWANHFRELKERLADIEDDFEQTIYEGEKILQNATPEEIAALEEKYQSFVFEIKP